MTPRPPLDFKLSPSHAPNEDYVTISYGEHRIRIGLTMLHNLDGVLASGSKGSGYAGEVAVLRHGLSRIRGMMYGDREAPASTPRFCGHTPGLDDPGMVHGVCPYCDTEIPNPEHYR